MQRDDWIDWKDAIIEEMKSLDDNQTWQIVDVIPKGQKTISSKWVFAVKDDGRFKARLVAKGCSQKPGFDYQETFAPVAKMPSIRVMLSMANEKKYLVHQMDVKTAFLYGDLAEEVYMRLPSDDFGGSKVVKLKKGLYGLKQAGRCWNKRFDMTMKSLGFTPLVSDCCIYRSNNYEMYIVLYVDDLLIIGKFLEEISKLKENLSLRFRMKDLNEVRYFLGLEIKRNLEAQTMEISQKKYVERVLEKFGMQDCNPVKTPMDINTQWEKNKQYHRTSIQSINWLFTIYIIVITS